MLVEMWNIWRCHRLPDVEESSVISKVYDSAPSVLHHMVTTARAIEGGDVLTLLSGVLRL
jgi:hypothetical protein